jgi:HEPN domain-containing protein
MRPFHIYHLFSETFVFYQQHLISSINEIVQPDIIYLLSASVYQRRTESIFNDTAPAAHHLSDFCLLILISNKKNRSLPEWEEMIEQHCSKKISVTTIVLETETFKEWFTTRHPFAERVVLTAVALFNNGTIDLALNSDTISETQVKYADEKYYKNGLSRVEAFLAAAELLKVRKEYNIALFMLHQAAEQSLRTMLKMGTGFHSCTHNIDRLLRYTAMVVYQLPDIFPRKTEEDKRLLKLLQNAYIDARYKEDHAIHIDELLLLFAKVNELYNLLKRTACKCIP